MESVILIGEFPVELQLLLSPHAGSATRETRAAMLRLTLDNLHAVLDGREALTPVAAILESN